MKDETEAPHHHSPQRESRKEVRGKHHQGHGKRSQSAAQNRVFQSIGKAFWNQRHFGGEGNQKTEADAEQ